MSLDKLRVSILTGGVALTGIAATVVVRSRRSRDGKPLRGVAGRFTWPLLPDDYLSTLINPLWSARELRGRVERVEPETEDSATLVIRPGWGWTFRYQAGQYIGIGVDVDGRWHWRSYSLTSPPQKEQGLISITVKAMPEGFLSKHLVQGLEPGTIVRLAAPKGDFVLPEPPPSKLLFFTGGSGITPIMGILRMLDRRHTMPDVVHIHSARRPDDALFRDELHRLEENSDSYRLVEHFSDENGHLNLSEKLDELVPDWRDREAWVCGPEPMLDAAEEFWKDADLDDKLHIERFTAKLEGGGEGGHVVFDKSGKEDDLDGATTLLEAGEKLGIEMPYGCRMGICHTCVVPLISGTVVDLRDGSQHDEDQVQTCVCAPAGDVVLAI